MLGGPDPDAGRTLAVIVWLAAITLIVAGIAIGLALAYVF